jgi:hypothetical protein
MTMAVLRLRRLACVLLVLLAANAVDASTVIFRTDAELVMLSERVVHGRVIRQRVERPDGPEGSIYTVTTLAVLEDFTGVPDRELEVWELGGVLGDEFMWIGGAVTYDLGTEVMVCLERGRLGLRSVAMGFSKFDVENGRLTRKTGDMNIVGGRAPLRAQELTLDEFRDLTARVRGVRPVRNADASLLQPEQGVTSSFTFLTFSNGIGARWTEADSGTPVNWYLNTSAPSPLTAGNGVAELQTALQAWNAPTTASIVLQYAGTTNQSAAKGSWSGIPNSGTGVVTFEDPNDEISGSTLAIGGGSGFLGGGGTVNGINFNKWSRGYVIWQNAANLSDSFKQTTNFARVMEHEIGHTIGLGHSAEGTANIMHPSCCAANAPVAPALGPDDLAGLNFIYPSGSTPAPPPATCTFQISPTSNSTAAAAGTTGSVAVTTQAGCAWTATVSSTAPFISITSGASGTGNGTVSYSVALNNTTAQRGGTIAIAGQTFTLTQLAATCTYAISPTSAAPGIAGGSATVTVTTNLTTCAWTATTPASFVTITSGASGTGNGTVGYTVAANSGVSFRQGTLTIGGLALTVTQSGTGPTMTLDKPSLIFGASSNGVGLVQQTGTQTVRLSQTGAGTVTWTATPSVPWVTVSPASGTGSATLSVSVASSSALPGAGAIAGAVNLTFTGAGVSSGPVSVGLNIYPLGTALAASGAVDTPADGIIGVTGSIGITGWAIDDIEVTQVRIVRDPVAGEPAMLIPIGTAVFVDGARPDIAALFSASPRRTRGGWGYLMLTNFLPNLGNGTFRIHAYADDADGHSTLIGSRTITCSNSGATAPFGAIDTPDQGATVSGAVYHNFGWVLSPGNALAYPPHGTVTVLIDGIPVGTPAGWVSRGDLTSLFPVAGYAGIANALGVATINTTTLANGLHTIAWVVTANNGQAAGIGSRYFTVQNTSGAVEEGLGDLNDIDAAHHDRSPIAGRRGYDLEAPLRSYAVGASGRTTVHGEELDRFELALGRPAGNETLQGYLRSGGTFAPLPAGSHLDPNTGVFTWQPGVGFVHAYDLVFVRRAGGRAASRQEVRIVINPKGSNRLGPQVIIDLPTANVAAGSAQPLVLAGWAIDTDADAGTGVDTIHVWAYPAGGGAPIFVGAAGYGGRRPDVAAIFGDRFRDSGYGILVYGLPPGSYDLAVFASSTVSGGFVPARVVRVTVGPPSRH